jgi:hypothetical protein
MERHHLLFVRAACGAAFLVLLAGSGIGCGSDHSAATAAPTATTTATPTSTVPAATATTTPLPSASGIENLFGATAQDSGALTIEPLALIPAYFSTCLGGSGDNCDGGNIVYIGSDPGFKEADATEATATLFALPDGVEVSLHVVAIDPALSLAFDNGTLNAAGQTLDLGTTPGIHADLGWQLLLPANTAFDAGHHVTLQLTTTASGFTNSAEFTETVQASSGTAPSGP